MKYVASFLYPISDRLDTSHRAGWAQYWAAWLGAEIITTSRMWELATLTNKDTVYFYHGMEFKGQLNLQSGLSGPLADRLLILNRMMELGVKVVSLDIPMPAYDDLIRVRAKADDPLWGRAQLYQGLIKMRGALTLEYPAIKNAEAMVIGDSHALAMAMPKTVILRHDALTLHGALNRGLLSLVADAYPGLKTCKGRLKKLTFYFGNIDIRHHLCRRGKDAVRPLVKAYGQQILTVAKALGVPRKDIEVVEALPIEDPSRRIPKSGWFKGTPFFGSWDERMDMRMHFNDCLGDLGLIMVNHPRFFYTPLGGLWEEVMEKPQSVHIRPAFYRWKL